MAAGLFFFILIILKVVSLSYCHICMTYTIGKDYLRLSCKVSKLEFEVLFIDPNNHEQAFCLMSYPNSRCSHHYRNSSINQNLSTNETALTIRGVINANVNGQWLCKHGNNFERATVDVKFDTIAGVNGLDITANQTLPFVHGTFVEITCTAYTIGRFAELTWECLNISNFKTSVLNCSTALSKIIYKASSVDNGSFCKCVAKDNRFLTSTYIKLNIQTNFEIRLIDHNICHTSTSMTLSCHMTRSNFASGFAPWIHSFNGIVIRYMKGIKNGTCSTIFLDSCALRDTGQYSCRAWVKEDGKISWKNKTSSLIINGPPVIITASMTMEPYLTLFVRFVCIPAPDILEWYMLNTLIQNQTNFKTAASKIILSQDMYEKKIGVDGYVANMTLQNIQDLAGYENAYVLISNMFGNTTYIYSLQKEGVFFPRQMLLWSLIVLAVFVISVIGTALLTTKRCNKNGQEDLTVRAIYYAAPESNNQPNLYSDIQPTIEEESNEHQYFEIEIANIDTDKVSFENRQSSSQSHYVDVDIAD